MHNVKNILVLIIVLGYSVISCTIITQLPTIEMPDIGIPPERLNKILRLQDPYGWNSFKVNDVITLSVEVLSNNQVIFSNDYGARVFIYKDNQWIEIRNKMKYPERTIILSPISDDPMFNLGTISVLPDLPDKNKRVTVRIFIIGNLYSNGEIMSEKVATFIDVPLRP